LQDSEFDEFYKPRLIDLILDPVPVVIGNARGADTACFDYLCLHGYPVDLITIYYYGSGTSEQYYTRKSVKVVKGFNSYTQRDVAMTSASSEELAWVRDPEASKILVEASGGKFDPKRKSGTELNLIRRQKMNAKTTSDHR
jgi:hypothetical protein